MGAGRAVSSRVLHQVSVGAAPGDAITDMALLLRSWLREQGYASELYALHIHPDLAREVRPVGAYRPGPNEQWVIYHHSIGSPVADQLAALAPRLMLIYHNVTPPEFFAQVNPALAQEMILGREQLARLVPRTGLALGVSAYNADELRGAGFAPVDVLPLMLDEREYQTAPDPAVAARWAGRGPRLLFVGRLVPHKRQEDVIKLLYYLRRADPGALLWLAGDPWLPEYAAWLHELVRDLRLEDAIHFLGKVPAADLVNYYRLADLYVSMSEHEGFGKPLVESMYLGLPVMAYAAGGIPGTLGPAGVQFHHKHFEGLAELAHQLVSDQALRQRLIAGQCQQAAAFLAPAVRHRWDRLLAGLGA
jgi:glycosyltransferase involved in cell wall biosynthesis